MVTKKQQQSFTSKQECIPVACVPSAAVAVCLGGVYPGGAKVCPGGEGLLRGVSAQGVSTWGWVSSTPLGQNS